MTEQQFRESRQEREEREARLVPEWGLQADELNLAWHNARRERYKPGDESKPPVWHLDRFPCERCGFGLGYGDADGWNGGLYHIECAAIAKSEGGKWNEFIALWGKAMEIPQ